MYGIGDKSKETYLCTKSINELNSKPQYSVNVKGDAAMKIGKDFSTVMLLSSMIIMSGKIFSTICGFIFFQTVMEIQEPDIKNPPIDEAFGMHFSELHPAVSDTVFI